MKKFYALILAAAIAMTASAKVDIKLERTEFYPVSQIEIKEKISSELPLQASQTKYKHISSMRKADAQNTIEGQWIFLVGDFYLGEDSANDYIEVEYTAQLGYSTTDGSEMVIFVDPTNQSAPIYCGFNSSTGLLTIERRPVAMAPVLGGLMYYYIYQAPFVINTTTFDLDFQTIQAAYSPSANVIVFEQYNGIMWPVYMDEEGTLDTETVYGMYDMLYAVKYTEQDLGTWTPIGNATLIDPWVLPATGVNQEEYPIPVVLEQNDAVKTLYRLVDPYQNPLFSNFNASTSGGYIMFDVSDPDHVAFEKVDAGFAHTASKITTFYCYNMLTAYALSMGVSPKELLPLLSEEDETIPFTTFKDGVISLGYIIKEDGKIMYDANFGTQTDPNGFNQWQTTSGQTANMNGKIIFPDNAGIEGVVVEPSDAPVTYFNLLGEPVQKPSTGVVIRVQNGKASKVFMK